MMILKLCDRFLRTHEVMKMVVEPSVAGMTWGIEHYWTVSRHLFDSHVRMSTGRTLKEALLMANSIADKESLVIEVHLKTLGGDGDGEDLLLYLRNEADVLQAILTYC